MKALLSERLKALIRDNPDVLNDLLNCGSTKLIFTHTKSGKKVRLLRHIKVGSALLGVADA